MNNEHFQKNNYKTFILSFVNDKNYFTVEDLWRQSSFVLSIKVSVESIAESIIPKYSPHLSKIRHLNVNKIHNKIISDCNWPNIGTCDSILKEALNHKFYGRNRLFNTSSTAASHTSELGTTKTFKTNEIEHILTILCQ